MSADHPTRGSKATRPLVLLRQLLDQARNANRPEEVHAALFNVVDGLISHAEKQERAIDDLRSDVSRKQGIVSSIDGGAYGPTPKPGAPANDERKP